MKLLLASDVEKVFDQVTQTGWLRGRAQGVFIPTASLGRPYGAFFEHVVRPNFRRAGVEMHLLELAQASAAEIDARLQAATVLYVGGGNTFRLLQHLRASGFAERLAAFFRRDGLYIGSSAGAVVVGPDVAFIACMDDNSAVQLRDFTGLNLLGFNVLPHLNHPQYAAAARQANLAGWPTIGLREEQLLCVDNGCVEVL